MSYRLEWNGPKITAETKDAASRGLKKGMEHLLNESRKEVPIEEGTLERSGKASVDGLKGAVAYDTEYAVKQHEDPTLKHDAGRKWKYLEQPMHRVGPDIMDLIAAEIRREWGT